MASYGLNALMECIAQEQSTQQKNDTLQTLFENEVPDRVTSLLMEADYGLDPETDSVNNDMEGHGIGYGEEQKLNEVLDKIPEDPGEDPDVVENDLDDILECVIGAI